MTIRKVFLLIIIFLVLTLTVGGGIIVSKNLGILSQAQSIEYKILPIVNRAHELKLAVVQVQQWLTDISATRGLDGLNDGFDEAEQNALHFNELVSELVSLDPDNASTYQAMLPIFDNYYASGKKMAGAYIAEGPAGGNKMMADFDVTAAKMTEMVDHFLSDVVASSGKRLIVLDKNAKFVSYFAGVIFTLVFVVVVIMYRGMLGVIISLENISRDVKGIASGDLGQAIKVEKSGEIRQLLSDLEKMRLELRHMVLQINTASNALSEDAENLSITTAQTDSIIQNQQLDIKQVSESIELMSSTAMDVASNTNQAALASSEATQRGDEGIAILEQNLQSIHGLISSVNETTHDIETLKEQSSKVDKVLSVIWDITEQTNLLALNAAIEAARAGESGRGFAVVANEVRDLAKRTQESASDIQDMITSIQNASDSVSVHMASSVEKASQTGKLSESTKDAFRGISSEISRINAIITQISSASEQQSEVFDTVRSKVLHINEISQQTSASSQQLSVTSQQVAQSSEALSEITHVFKV